ncbi:MULTISPECIES: hypothetical protein [Alteromonas]|jgi:hypothetical protein|uniref:Uncharacterized protein n=1 Tax=Alteromonas mediterranea (strain DSM 17117 / CIP 110805 / LMG 28347 / Deep ecotype) TaxID=1774373 RepID=F2G2D9_ALTMD|nr:MULTISPECIES: hypothetical protein [Alteromonas]MBR9786211.1 hypothetical protein [Gammaproteobacteria bacterium]MDY6883296.1 hypothetical protein [Pseudomonadota bacterium]AEA98219.2 hypothetical protein MADE_1010405 [Alteromonas mediterranea DE]AGP81988.1 hypothetical protein I533_10090 [Alteromonas mediterranea MED64]MBR9895928.1 hypothetical protein [Gammaproteobacteria bacterium]|tara:strand:- start:18910 stop:19389 length:480 start_codon:yes stop_codon:yes gene_type:complete
MLKKNNNKRSEFLHSQLPLLAIIVVAVCVYLAHEFQSSAMNENVLINGIGNSCNFVNETCEFLIDGEVAIATFSTMPEPEESVTLKILIPENQEIESAWIEGVNMYMGKIPVLLDNDGQGKWSGWFMLGSCSEPVMKWQLRLNIEGKDNPHYLYFVTQQ